MKICGHNLTEEQIRKSGERIRSICEEKNITQWDMADLIGYKNRNVISDCWNGTKPLKPDKYKILSEEWGYRIAYLLAVDDVPTEEEYQNILGEQFYKEEEELHNHLKPLFNLYGYEIEKMDYIRETSSKEYIIEKNKFQKVIKKQIYNGIVIAEEEVKDDDEKISPNSHCTTMNNYVYEITFPRGSKLYIQHDSLQMITEMFFNNLKLMCFKDICFSEARSPELYFENTKDI